MKLKEFDVAELGADFVGQSPAVGRRHPGIGGDLIQLAHSTGRENDCRCRQYLGWAALPDQRDANDMALPIDQAGDLGVLQDLDFGMIADHLCQTADEGGAGAVSPRMDDPGSSVGRFQA